MDEKNYKILVVDDEQDLCEILKFNLETEGYLVETANSAEEALEKDIASYDLLLLDVMRTIPLPVSISGLTTISPNLSLSVR